MGDGVAGIVSVGFSTWTGVVAEISVGDAVVLDVVVASLSNRQPAIKIKVASNREITSIAECFGCTASVVKDLYIRLI